MMISLVSELGSEAHKLQWLQHAGSVVLKHGLYSTDSVNVVEGLSCPTASGVFPDHEWNPHPLYWQVHY